MEFRGGVNYQNINNITLALSADWQGQHYELGGSIIDKSMMSMSGSYGFAASIAREVNLSGDGSIYSVVLNLDHARFPVKNHELVLSLDSSGRARSLRDWHFDLYSLDAELLGKKDNTALHTLRCRGQLNQDTAGLKAALDSVYYDDGKGVLSGSAQAEYQNGKLTADISLASTAGEVLSASCITSNGISELRSNFSGFQAERLIKGSTGARIDGYANMFVKRDETSGSLGIESAQFNLTKLNMQVLGQELNAQCSGALTDDTASLNTVEARLGGIRLSLQDASLIR
jgi:hypothetical protein